MYEPMMGGVRAKPYTEEDIAILEELARLNGKRGNDPKRESRAQKFMEFRTEKLKEKNYARQS